MREVTALSLSPATAEVSLLPRVTAASPSTHSFSAAPLVFLGLKAEKEKQKLC